MLDVVLLCVCPTSHTLDAICIRHRVQLFVSYTVDLWFYVMSEIYIYITNVLLRVGVFVLDFVLNQTLTSSRSIC